MLSRFENLNFVAVQIDEFQGLAIVIISVNADLK